VRASVPGEVNMPRAGDMICATRSEEAVQSEVGLTKHLPNLRRTGSLFFRARPG
jgi:hypothetical protein